MKIRIMSETSQLRTPTEIVAQSVITEASDITYRTNDALTTNDAKKRRINEVYDTNNKWKEEDTYEEKKVRHMCREHLFPNLKFVMGEGQKLPTTKLEKRKKKTLEYGKCHEKADLLLAKGYACHLMKLMDITEDNTKIEDRAVWWKTYAHSVKDEIRKIRGRTSGAIKRCVTQGMWTLCLYD